MSGAIAHARRRARILVQANAPRPNLGNSRMSLFRHSTAVPRNSTTTPVDSTVIVFNDNAQARGGLYSSPACCPEPLARGVLDGRHHSSYP